MRAGVVAVALAVLGLAVPSSAPSLAEDPPFEARASDGDGVLARTVIGRTVRKRPVMAYHLGDPEAPGVEKVVIFSTMHGNEDDTHLILEGLVEGPWVTGLDLWVVPVYNPDGFRAGSRKNAHGVDLNRNFPYRWKDLDGSYESGPRPASEPETRAVMRFLRDVDPDWVISFHQPLTGVDTDTKSPAFARRVARELHLPTRTLDCGSVCHGTMTMWFNRHFDGAAITVEYGASPSRSRLYRMVPDQVLRVFGAARGELGADELP